MEIHFIGVSRITLHADSEGENERTTLKECNVSLQVSRNLERGMYLDDGLPGTNGIKPLTQCFVQGLIANIHRAHDKDFMDKDEHLAYIMDELKRSFNCTVVSEDNET